MVEGSLRFGKWCLIEKYAEVCCLKTYFLKGDELIEDSLGGQLQFASSAVHTSVGLVEYPGIHFTLYIT